MWVSSVAAGSSTGSTPGMQTITGEDFMSLLITQMSNQDPMNPMSNEDMSAQLAQFSSLDELETLNTTMADQLTSSSLSFASSLIGSPICAFNSKTKNTIEGVVESVSITDSVPYINVGGAKVSIYDLTNVKLAK